MYIYYKIYKSMRRGRIHGEKNMRDSRTKTQTKLRNYIKLTAGALLLAITFVLVFAGTLSGAFGIENELQQNGIIENNVASADETATYTFSGFGTFQVVANTKGSGALWHGSGHDDDHYLRMYFTQNMQTLISLGAVKIKITGTYGQNGDKDQLWCRGWYGGGQYNDSSTQFYSFGWSKLSKDQNTNVTLLDTTVLDSTQVNICTDAKDDGLFSTIDSGFYNIVVTLTFVDRTFFQGSGSLENPFLLQKRADFDILSAVINTNRAPEKYNSPSSYYYIDPDTSISGQNATTIEMGSTAFTPIGNSTTKFAGTLLGNGCTINGLVTNGQYSGLFGYVNNAHIENLTVNVSNDSGNTSAGGLVGVVNGTTTITNCNVSGTVKGTHQIGGFVGFAQDCVLTISNGNNSATITTTGQKSNDKGRTSGGGIVGYVNENATVTINDVTNTGAVKTESSSANSGLGGIVGFSNGKTIINNCNNTASITGHAGLGGIVGYTANGSIVGCRNDGNITSSKAYNLGADSASYSGGIAGYCYADVAKCYNSGTVKTTSDWANSNQVAGIAAYLGSGRNVKYCYNEGQIEGSDYVGGIVGKRAGTVSYSYQAGKIKGLYNRTSTIGHITGNDTSKISTCWTLPGASNLTTVTNTFNHNGYTVNSEANVAMKPAFGNAVLGGWNDITVTGATSGTFSEITGIDQFVFYPNNIEHEIENNKYLFVYDTSANAVALVPNHIDSGVSVITDTTTASVAKTVPFVSRFFFNASSDKNLVASISPIDAPLTSTQTVYNGSGQKVTTDVVGADIQEKSYYFTSGNDNALAKSEFIDVGEYDIVTEVTMKVGENTYVVVGRQVRNNHWTIAQRKISFWNKVYYYGETPTNAPVPQSMSGDEGLLNGHIFTCTYANDLTYDFMYGAIPNAKKEVTINMTGEIRDAAGNDVTYNYDFQNGTFTISMREGNFGVKGTTDIVNNPWGSQGNPFVIKTAQHLVNLSKIVNGETPYNADTTQIVNSIYNNNQYKHVVNNNTRTYKNCYFVIVKDIDMTGINFAPVGKSETYFFEGNVSGVKSIEDTSQQNRFISNLTVNLASTDNVGLFGYVRKTGTETPYIKHIVLNNSCSFVGKSNVGSIAGWAQDAIIQNCINNATVEGKGENAGGIVGKNFGTETSNCENHGTVKGAKNVGGIVGTLDWGVISNVQNSAMVEASGENCGGIVGYMISYSTLKDVTNNAQVNGNHKTGGVLGYYVKNTVDSVKPIYNLTNTKPVVGASNVGGIIGCVAGDLTFDGNNENQKCTMSGVSVKGTFNVGGLVGGVENNSTVTLKNFTNNANVIGGYVVGGLVGLLRGAITSSVNNADITSEYNKAGTPSGLSNGAYVGGIVGVAYGTISHCYNSGNISASGDNSDFLGGIVGYTNSNVLYCTSLANSSISGSNQVGGIAGKLQNATIDHCYFNGTIVGIWNNSGAKLDFICGEKIDGLVSNSWKLPNAQNGDTGNRTYTNAGNALTIATGMTFKPYFVQEGSEHDTEWEQILSKNIVGFSVSGNVPTNSYFNSDNGNDTAYVKPDKTNGFAANSTSGNVTAWYGADFGSDVRCSIVEIQIDTTADEYNGKQQGLTREDVHMPSANNGVYAVQFAYKGNQYGDVIPKDVDEYNTTVTVKIDEKVVGVRTDVKYKITKKKVTITNIWTWKFVNGSNADFYKFEYNKDIQGMLSITVDGVLQNSHYTLTQTENKAAVGEYSSSVVISDRDYEVEIVSKYCTIQNNNANLETDNAKYGIKTTQTNANTSNSQTTYTYNWKIVPYSLATNITSGNVWFGGRTDLIVGNQGIANVEGDTTKSYYPLQADKKGAPGVQQVLVYAQHNYTADKFVLYVKYNNGTVAVLTQGTEYTLSALDAPTVENPTPLNTSVTASGTGNFSGNITKWYTALFSDFGWKKDKSPSDKDWGSQDNPYVISTPEHLLRLSQIVNGGMAWNSIQNTVTAGVCIAPQTTAKATSRDYKDAYFLVTVDIDMSGYISTDGVYNFLPIGTRSTQNQTELPFSATFDGGDNTITYVYNVGSFYNVDGARKNYVGLFGYLNGATISNLKVASNGGLSITDNSGIVGIEYVGGIAGYAVDSTLYNSVLAYGGWVRGETYVGGIVGYGERITIVSSEAVSSANLGGETYVGGIVGKWIVSNQSQIGGSVAGQRYITPADQIDVMGIKYVGGIAGWMDTSSCATTISYAPQLNNNGKDGNFIVVGGIEYVGALFGAFIGNGYHQNATNDKYTAIVIDKDASDNFKVGNVKVILQNLNEQSASGNAKVVGGLVGYAEGVGILFNTDWTTSNVTLDTGNYTPSFIGGIAGVLGKNATIEAIYQLKDDGTFLTGGTHTITHSVPDEQKTFGTAAKPLGSFVGGIVGYVSSQAGVYWETGTTIFGNGISLVNLATIYATSYAGGIFGALGDIPASFAKDFESDSILYKVLTTGVREGSASTTLGLAPTVSGNGITAQGRLVNNASISVSGSYVGGIAGYGGAKVRFVLRNTPQDSAIDVSKLNIYSGGSDIFINGSYAGGIAGYLVDNLEHDLQYIVVKARFNTNNQSATRVGGLVGYMGSGNVQNCVVTNGGSSAITASTDTYQGSEYVGGLVGETQNATIRNSVSTGFNLEKTSNTKGGLLGYGANPTIDSSWTFYIAKKRTNFAKNATPNGAYYATVSQSPYGKYILVDEGLINATEASYPTFVSLCGFVGLLTNANVEGTLEFAVKVPNKTLNSNYENTQLAFYNASGSDTVTDNVDSFSKFENNNNTLTIALDMASGNSMQICVVGIEFVNVPQKNDTDTDKTTVVEGKYRKPSNSDKYIVHVTTANFNSERQITKIVATVYFECNDNLPVVIGSAYDDKRNIGGYDETFTPGSSTNPYTISSQKEWNDFAYSVYSGAKDYAGEYVKLLTNITINNTTAHMGTASSSTPLNFSTECTPNNNSDDNKNAKSNLGYNLAGNISQGSSAVNRIYFGTSTTLSTTTPSFKGTFDGNGNTIEINVNTGTTKVYAHRMSVFPNASNATFENLTITGEIIGGDSTATFNSSSESWSYNSAYDIAGFVGKPFGPITFKNCTNATNIQGLRLIAGFAGCSTGSAPISLIGCVNKGNITSFERANWTKRWYQNVGNEYDYDYGTGGLIAYASANVIIESCLNTGNITGCSKIGGLVGRVTSANKDKTIITVDNCANTGEITSNDYNPFKANDTTDKACNVWAKAGGLIGEVDFYSQLFMYASYNTGKVKANGSVAGGLVGLIGTIPGGNSNNKPGFTETLYESLIAYCYNAGNVEVGYQNGDTGYGYGGSALGTSGNNYNGSEAAGIVAVTGAVKIDSCYNTGAITAYGCVGALFAWHTRIGGIVAEVTTHKNSNVNSSKGSNLAKGTINNCYNVGVVATKESTNSSCRYSADIIGYLESAGGTISVNNCYGVRNNILLANTYYSGWNSSNDGDSKWARTGTTLNSRSDLTAILRDDGTIKPKAYAGDTAIELWTASTSTIGKQNTTGYKNGTLGGYVYVYGCLPQLAVFAVDTYNGLSMNSQNFGKDIYGEYKAQNAGDKYNPYVIRDGIDLMGVQTLVNLGYTFEKEYIEFANGSNNITLDKNLSSDVAKAINMPTTNESNSGGQKIKDTDYAYMASSDGTTYNQIGKSYHLFKQGAVCKDDNNSTANKAYQTWVGRTYYYDGAYNYVNDWASNATFKVQNMLSIGRNGNVFKGSISGKQVDNDKPDKPVVNTVINNLRIMTGKTNGGAYAGLFGHIEDAYVGYIEVGGGSNIWSFSYNNSDISVAGGVVAYMTGGSVVEHCVLSGTASVGAYGIDDKTNITTLSKPDFTYAGGIVGLADTKQGDTYNAGIVGTIKDCIIDITTANNTYSGIISGSKSNIGGVLGYVGGDAGANGKGNSVRIEGCEVQKAAIQAVSSATESSHIGGVLGYGSDYVAAFITGCKVGNGADTVTIKGEHSLGGIAGGMSNAKGGYIDSCTVGAKTSIERINQGGDKDDKGNDKVSENPDHGTAIGGFVGFTEKSTNTTSPLTTTFSGKSSFLGKIKVTVGTTNPGEHGDKKPVDNVGGIVGDMGSGANFASGSDVTVRGTIDIKNNQGDWLAAANVGGVAGRTSNATFIGKFDVSPTMNTTEAENVGGFIGKNVGTVYILADTTERIVDGKLNGTNITIGGTIKGTSEVGGFIGVNNSGSTLNIGSNIANAKAYKSGTLSIIIAEGATISGSGNHVGGIVGKNEGVANAEQNDYATIDIVKGTIVQKGTISGKNYVGGIIGLNAGLLTTGGGEADEIIGGIALDENQIGDIKNLSITNGNVKGDTTENNQDVGNVKGGTTENNQYVGGDCVGGVIGWLDAPQTLRDEHKGKGDIAGVFTNSGSVEGNRFVGGSLGFVGKYVNIATKGGVNTLFVNTGNVTAHSTFVGGSIGAIVGQITGAKVGTTVNFENQGTVNGLGYVGGSIGVLAGQTQFAQFVNTSKKDFTIDACNSVGGSVGYIGMPDALKAVLDAYFEDKDPTYSDIDITVKNVHFEASGNLTANPTDATLAAAKDDGKGGVVDDNDWGGVGGAIGVLGRNQLATWENNTYYANGNVIAQNVNNVGGIIGLINANDITIGNLLAYNITVTGAKNVGGIVGATNGTNTKILSAYTIEGTFSGTENVGGIIGLANSTEGVATDAKTSYWVKGYSNAVLAGADVKDLQQTLGKFETIVEQVTVEGKQQSIVFTEDFCKLYTPKTYYADYPGTHTYNGETVTPGENVEQLTWDNYFKDKLGETSAQIKNGAWVKTVANAVTFTTGTEKTGWYFVYATDKTIGTIKAEHSTNANLQYWKRIADAYTSSERNEGKDDNVKNPLASDIVLGNGAPQKSTLYATAKAAGEDSGYYLYMATSGQSRPTATYSTNKFFIQVLTTTTTQAELAQNVAIYYRTISKGKTLTYNGYLRYAPVGITVDDGKTVPYVQTPQQDAAKKDSYCYSADTTTGGNATGGAQIDPGNYESAVKIYYYDKDGKPYVVGGVSIKWEIKARQLSADIKSDPHRVYGDNRNQDDGHDMKVVISNIAPGAGTPPQFVITVTDKSSNPNVVTTFKYNGNTLSETKNGITLTATSVGNSSNNEWEANDNLYNVNEPTDINTKDVLFYIDFTNAKTYEVSVAMEQGDWTKRYTLDAKKDFSVNPAELKLAGEGTDSVKFDNKEHGYSWKITGFKYEDGMEVLAAFSPTAYALEKSAPLYKSETELLMGDVTIKDIADVKFNVQANSKAIVISGAKLKGSYYIGFATLKAGNYTLKLEGGVELEKKSKTFAISNNKFTFDWSNNGSQVYNKKSGTITLTIKTDEPLESFDTFIKNYFSFAMSGSGASATLANSSGKQSVVVTFTSGVNADTYTAKVSENNNAEAKKFRETYKSSCSYPNLPQSRTWTINQRELTFSLGTMSDLQSYTYNADHQGLTTIRVNGESGDSGLLSGDSVQASWSVVRSGNTDVFRTGTANVTTSSNNNVAGLNSINHGTYTATVTLNDNTNYKSAEKSVSWIIKKYSLNFSDLAGGKKEYDGTAVTPTLKVNGVEITNGQYAPLGEIINIVYSIKEGNTNHNSLVNVGTYEISVSGNTAITSDSVRDNMNVADNYEVSGSLSADYEITPRQIKLTWETTESFVFNDKEQGLRVLRVDGINGTGKLAVKTNTSTINGVELTGYAGNDTIVLGISGAIKNVNDPKAHMTAVISSVNGKNADNVSVSDKKNYEIVDNTNVSGEFTITPFVVNISFNTSAGAILLKEYNANEDVPKEQIKDSYFTWSKISGTNLPSSNPFTITGKYYDIKGEHYDKNVGTGKCVMFTYTFTDPSGKGNYKAGTVDTAQHNVGQITPAHIKVALNKLRSGKATRTFTNDVWYGGEAGASGNGNSEVYRSGEGFTISGVFSSDDIKVVAKYAEAGDDRAMFDKYVNDVEKNENTFTKVASGTHLKMLVFEMTGKDATNYTFNVYDTSDKAYSKNNGDSQTPVNVYDKDDEKNNKDKLSQIKIEITVKTYKVEYTNAAQSYANADNTYNTNWERVGVSNNPPGVTVTVSNGWMYADGQDHGDDEQAEKKVYKAYTTIRGSQNSVRLGAKISGIDGMELNYKMVNQPILTIGYFVVDNNDVFEIGSASSLMIASYYWWVAQNGQNPDFNLPLVATSTWHKIVSNDDYMTKPFEKPSDAPNNVDMSEWDWDMYFAWFEQQNNVKIFLNETGIPNEDGTWGYYTTGEESQKKQYTKYRMVRDFSGKLSESDIAILEAFFPKDKGWGVGKTYLDNFLNTSVGSVLTAVGSVFRWYNGSVGQFEFDGNGYVIEYLNIMGYDNENVGLFDVIGANGIVKNLHLRNITINANKGNVGGIAGSIAAAEGDADATKNVTNVSFHGKITATGGTVGGLFGTSARAIDGAIVLGEISATNAIVGGVVGTATAGLNNVVSMMQITASGGTVGAFTSDNANVGEKCTHMTKAVWKKGTSGTGFVNVKDKNVGYNALMSGSNSLYANGTSDLGTYDVISETFADSGQNVNPRQSKRLRDMVSVYLLMYSLSVNGEKYTISSSSWLVGTADGTNAKPIVIANKQNVSLLRELRFAAFMLKANVSIEIASTFSGAFYGSVTSAVNESGVSYDYKITCNKQMFEAYATTTQAWLEVKP